MATDSFPPKIDGVADTAATVARVLSRMGHTVRVVAPAPGPREGAGWLAARVESVPAPMYPELRLAVGVDRVVRIARARGWEGAIVLTPGPIGAVTALALREGVPMLNVYTTDIPRYLQTYGMQRLVGPATGLIRRMATRATATLCPTRFVQTELERLGFPRLEVWGRGVDMELFNPGRRSQAVRELLTAGNPAQPLVLYVGRLAREKRLDALAEVAAIPGVRLAIVGDGPERARLEGEFAGLPVVFTGYLRGVALAEAFASADVFVFPSASDTFGQVVLQAMASGVPPVVVTGSAPAELVPPGVCGLHAAPGRPGALARAVGRLVEDDALRRAMSAAASEHARRFSWEALVGRLVALLDPEGSPGHVDVPTGVAK